MPTRILMWQKLIYRFCSDASSVYQVYGLSGSIPSINSNGAIRRASRCSVPWYCIRTVVYSASHRPSCCFVLWVRLKARRLLFGRRTQKRDGNFFILYRVFYFCAALGAFQLRCRPLSRAAKYMTAATAKSIIFHVFYPLRCLFRGGFDYINYCYKHYYISMYMNCQEKIEHMFENLAYLSGWRWRIVRI